MDSTENQLDATTVLWSLASWTAAGILHFFVLQFVADTRTRDYVLGVANRGLGCSFYLASIAHAVVMLFWGFSAWAVWMHGGFIDRAGILIAYFFMLVVELFGFVFLWSKRWLNLAGVVFLLHALYVLIAMIATCVYSGAGTLLLPYAIYSIVQALNYWKFYRANASVKFRDRLPSRLSTRSTRANANAFFVHQTQDPAPYVIDTSPEEPQFEIGSSDDIESV